MDQGKVGHHTKVMPAAFSPIHTFKSPIEVLLTDIDDTLTDDGRLGAVAYASLWKLQESGISVVPVTGRPAGWCELIARQWPVRGVVGENGGFYFSYDRQQKKMKRHSTQSESEQKKNREKLSKLEEKILREVPGSAVASDQFCRLLDLAIDFCEDVPRLPWSEVEKIRKIFEAAGAQARVSSIHVNGWFGHHNKLSESLVFLEKEMGITPASAKLKCAFVGDSPNDEPMWEYFPHSIAVANIAEFMSQLKTPPKYVCSKRGGAGFAELSSVLLGLKS